MCADGCGLWAVGVCPCAAAVMSGTSVSGMDAGGACCQNKVAPAYNRSAMGRAVVID